MRSLTGFVLLSAGLAVGAHAYYPDTLEKHVHLGKVARILTPPATTSTDATASRSFSPGYGTLTTRSDSGGAVPTVSQPGSPILQAAPKVVRGDGWNATVVRSGPTLVSGSYARSLKAKELSGADRWQLVRDLQEELRRVGCYSGRIDGSWGNGSKWAMQEFLKQANSTLPNESPDHVMLSLLRSHSGVVCGRQCSDGYTKSANGRCLPYAITASAERQATPSTTQLGVPPARLVRSGVQETTGSAAQYAATAHSGAEPVHRPPLDGRMAVGGPIPSDVDPRLSARGVPVSAPLTRAAQEPPVRRASKTKKRTAATRTKRRYSSVSRKRARQKALIRQAFGDGFD